jgi:hypothetical protein
VTEPRATWFQRLVGVDGAAIEEQLLESREQVRQLGEELARERQKGTQQQEELAQLRERAAASGRGYEAKLLALSQSAEERRASYEALETQQKQTAGELVITRNQLVRQREELGKLTKSLAASSAQVERLDVAVQTARAQATELEGKLAEQGKEIQEARARADERERAREASAKELADTKRRLQASEARASSAEHDLAEKRQALQSAQAELQGLGSELATTRLTRAFAVTRANDSWRALGRAVGDAATLALALGVETGAVDAHETSADAAAALRSALEQRGRCRAVSVTQTEDGVLVELSSPELVESVAAAAWFAAFTSRFLEKSLGVELAAEDSSVEQDTLKLRLRTSATTG